MSDAVRMSDGGETIGAGCTICGTPAAELIDFSARTRVRCPTCGSLERHRIMHGLWEDELRVTFGDRPIRALLCSPSQCERSFLFADLQTYDLDIGVDRYADLFVDVCDAVGLRDASFDLIVANGILAHVYDLDATLDEWRRILRPGGMLLVTTPVVDGAETVTHDLAERTRLWGTERYERLRIGTYRLSGSVDLHPAFEERFALRIVEGTDPATGAHERIYVLTRPPRTAPAPAAGEPATGPTEGYAFQRCRVAGRTFAFCLDGPPQAHDLPVTDLLGDEVATLHVDAFDPTGDYAAAPPEAPWETGMAWPLRARLPTQSRMRPGVYLVDGRIPFVVRHPGSARVAVVLPSLAGTAFNDAGGRRLSASADAPGADVLSFLRPLAPERLLEDAGGVMRWLAEADPFPGDTTYVLDADLHEPETLEGVELLVVVGRSTYWTRAMREHVDAHVAAGGRLLILGAEVMHWQVRLHGWRQQLIRHAAQDPEPDPLLHTRMWHDDELAYPVAPRTGGEYWYGGRRAVDQGIGFGGMRVVADAASPILRAAELRPGAVVALDASAWDGVPVRRFDRGRPEVDLGEEAPWRHEVLGFNRVLPAVPAESAGAPATSCWMVLRRTPDSGTVVHGGTLAWSQQQAVPGEDGDAARGATLAMMRLLLADEWPFAAADDRP